MIARRILVVAAIVAILGRSEVLAETIPCPSFTQAQVFAAFQTSLLVVQARYLLETHKAGSLEIGRARIDLNLAQDFFDTLGIEGDPGIARLLATLKDAPDPSKASQEEVDSFVARFVKEDRETIGSLTDLVQHGKCRSSVPKRSNTD